MLLGIFLYNGTMFYELKNGTLVETKDAQGNFDLTQVLGNKYLEDVDSEKCVIVDTYSNRCFLISKDLLHHGVSEEVYHKMLDSDETDSNKSSEEVTFILTITYKCNMHCTYCYQQNDKTLEKKLISDETLDKILSIIAQYMEANPNKTVRLGLFGGEPLLIENEKVIDKILQFCKEHKTTVHITTNGSFLSYYLKKFIINRRFISGIYPTIDSMALNYMTRYDLDPSRNNTNETFKLLGRLDGRYTPLEQIDLLMQAIQLTVPRFDLESIESFLYTRDEITIINQIGLAYSDAGQNKKAAEIYYQLLKYVRKHFKETITPIGVLPLVLYNYARVLDLCGRYEEGAALAKEGREACIQYGHYQVLPRCLEIEAECRHFMGDDEISKELYYQSYYLCKVIGYQIGLEVVKKEAKEYLNIDFMS